jgi:hypothetical protein
MGNGGVVLVDASAIAEVLEFTVNDERAVVTASQMGGTYVGHGIGKPRVSGTCRCRHDPADADQTGLRDATATFALILRPRGTGSTLPEFNIATAYITKLTHSVSDEDWGMFEFDFVADAALVETPQV